MFFDGLPISPYCGEGPSPVHDFALDLAKADFDIALHYNKSKDTAVEIDQEGRNFAAFPNN